MSPSPAILFIIYIQLWIRISDSNIVGLYGDFLDILIKHVCHLPANNNQT